MAKEKRTFTVRVLNENSTLYYGECNALTVPSIHDTISILPYHTPLIMMMGSGSVTIRLNGQRQTITEVKRGLVFVGDNEVSVLVNL